MTTIITVSPAGDPRRFGPLCFHFIREVQPHIGAHAGDLREALRAVGRGAIDDRVHPSVLTIHIRMASSNRSRLRPVSVKRSDGSRLSLPRISTEEILGESLSSGGSAWRRAASVARDPDPGGAAP